MSAQKWQFDKTYTFITDAASMAVFDPTVIIDRVEDDVVWFAASQFHELKEVVAGDCAIVGLGNDGGYKIRVTQEELTEEEKAFAKDKAHLGLKIVSGNLVVGALEVLPGGNIYTTFESINDLQGGFIDIPNGEYDLHIYGLDYNILNELPDDADIALQDSLPDIVVVITPRTEKFVAPAEENVFFIDTDKPFLFASPLRKKILAKRRGAQLIGKRIKAKVYKSTTSEHGFSLREHDSNWPNGYDVELEDYSQIQWKDRLVLEITAVDKTRKLLTAKVVEKEPTEAQGKAQGQGFIDFFKKLF